jgi:glycosyltransferase involved in cell wall biosynthesis
MSAKDDLAWLDIPWCSSPVTMVRGKVPRLRLLFACRIRSESDRIRESEVQQAIEAMGLTEMVHLRNTVPDMRPLIGASDVVVLPLETMRDKLDLPTTLLEFLAAGKPILISDLPPMRELVVGPSGERTQEKEVGVLTPPGDATALADAAVALLDDAALRERMGRRGQALVRNHYNIHSVARQYNQLYQELAA